MGGCLPMAASGDDRNGDGVNSGDDRNGDGGNSGDDRNGDGSGAHGCWEDQDCEDKDCEDKDCEGGFFCNRSDGPETKGNCEFRNAWDIRNCPSNANVDTCWADSAYGLACGQQEALRQEQYDAVMSTPIGLDGDQKGRYNAYLRNCKWETAGTAYPQGTCGHHRWGSDADGHSKCAGRQPFHISNPLLFSTYADDPEACCMAGIGGGGCDTSADCPYGRQCHCPQSHVRRRLLFSREKKCTCAA